MSLLEQFNYLIDHGIIKVAEPNSKNLFEQNVLREFKKELEYSDDRSEEIEELKEELEELQERIDELDD